ncbi:MAG: hypothetical protein HYX32_12585 [Actinobacteria bacterium]|nr:hypothetical protein [Actinomycetota bacterium]
MPLGGWLVRASAMWAGVQTILWIVALAAVPPQAVAVPELLRNTLAVTALVLVTAWAMASILASRHRRHGERSRPWSRLALPMSGLAVVIGLLIAVIGNALWSDEVPVMAALSASLTACLGSAW